MENDKRSIKFIVPVGCNHVDYGCDLSIGVMKSFFESAFIVIVATVVTIAIVSIGYSFLFKSV